VVHKRSVEIAAVRSQAPDLSGILREIVNPPSLDVLFSTRSIRLRTVPLAVQEFRLIGLVQWFRIVGLEKVIDHVEEVEARERAQIAPPAVAEIEGERSAMMDQYGESHQFRLAEKPGRDYLLRSNVERVCG
jgi:hypothetical protein